MQTVEKTVNHVFTPAEVTELRKSITDNTLLLSEKETIKKSVSATVSMLQSHIVELVIKVREGRESRKMACPIEYRWNDNKKDILHPETGEIISTEDITLADREQHLPLEDEGKTRKNRK